MFLSSVATEERKNTKEEIKKLLEESIMSDKNENKDIKELASGFSHQHKNEQLKPNHT